MLRRLAFDVDSYEVLFDKDLETALQFSIREHAVLLEEFEILLVYHLRQSVHGAAQVEQPTTLCLSDPLIRVVVAIEDHMFEFVDLRG